MRSRARDRSRAREWRWQGKRQVRRIRSRGGDGRMNRMRILFLALFLTVAGATPLVPEVTGPSTSGEVHAQRRRVVVVGGPRVVVRSRGVYVGGPRSTLYYVVGGIV